MKLHGKKQVFSRNAPARQYTWSTEQRRSVRFPCGWKIKLCDLRANKPELHHGKCRNLSQGGMKITGFQPLKRKSIVLIEIDPNLFSVHINLNQILKISGNQILAQVVWRHLNLETDLFEAGVEFIEEKQRLYYLSDIEKTSLIN